MYKTSGSMRPALFFHSENDLQCKNQLVLSNYHGSVALVFKHFFFTIFQVVSFLSLEAQEKFSRT